MMKNAQYSNYYGNCCPVLTSQLLVLVFGSTRLPASLLQPGQQPDTDLTEHVVLAQVRPCHQVAVRGTHLGLQQLLDTRLELVRALIAPFMGIDRYLKEGATSAAQGFQRHRKDRAHHSLARSRVGSR